MYILYIVYSIPVEVRAAGYVGPTVEAVELSESDKKYIVKLYSDIEEGISRRALEIIHS